jgi:hypothetical protein
MWMTHLSHLCYRFVDGGLICRMSVADFCSTYPYVTCALWALGRQSIMSHLPCRIWNSGSTRSLCQLHVADFWVADLAATRALQHFGAPDPYVITTQTHFNPEGRSRCTKRSSSVRPAPVYSQSTTTATATTHKAPHTQQPIQMKWAQVQPDCIP